MYDLHECVLCESEAGRGGQAPWELESHRVVNLLMSVLERNSASLKEQQALFTMEPFLLLHYIRILKTPKNILKLCFM